MNRFLTKKRAKKPAAELPKPEIDFSAALPSSDEFRTSLLMPNLSARFSMLREQDDPGSLIGKASDDSVLTPNRRSRLLDLSYQPGALADIAEVSSVNGSIRPFAPGRQDSFASVDGYGTDESGSVMTRSKPGEGNNLFGGRQKVYKIPVGAASSEKSLAASTKSGMGGRAVYENDVHTSAFQKYRQEAREREEREARENMDQESPAKGSSTSPSLLNYNNKRETSSSTASGQNVRTSTAATSINSQGPNAIHEPPPLASPNSAAFAPSLDRSGTKSRRLYDQGLDKEIQDQQFSTLNRLNSIQRPRPGVGPPQMSQPKSAPNLQDRYQRGGLAGRMASPSPHPLSPIGSKPREVESPELSPFNYSDSRPMSPLGSDLEDSSLPAGFLDPKDRGKATALGVFNKPAQYSEHEFLQRQKTLKNGWSTSSNGRSTPNLVRAPPKASKPPGFAFSKPEPSTDAAPARSRSTTDTSLQSEHNAFSVFQNAAKQIKSPDMDQRPSPQPDTSRSFLVSPDPSDTEFDRLQTGSYGQGPPRVMKKADIGNARLMAEPPRDDHPAFRANSPFEPVDRPDHLATPPMPHGNGSFSDVGYESHSMPNPHSASDGAQPVRQLASAGLSSMVRQHLRGGSGVSSIYDLPSRSSTDHVRLPLNGHNPSYGQDSSLGLVNGVQPDMGYASSPWERSQEPEHRDSVSPGYELDSDDVPWQQQLKKTHSRGASTETAAEREAFAHELEKRQKAIQEKLKNNIESETRSTSPTPSRAGGLKAMNILRAKSSRDSFSDRDQAPKAKKILGKGGSSNGPTSAFERRAEEDRPVRTGKYGVPIPPDPEDSFPPFDRPREASRTRDGSQPPKGRSPPTSIRSSGRNRSDSEASGPPGGRSRSRSGRYKDDLDKAMAEGTSSRTNSIYPDTYSTPDILSQNPMPPPPMPQLHSSHSSPRLRSNSKPASPAAGNAQWDQSHLHPAMRSGPSSGAPSPRLPQALGMNSASSPNLVSRPSPSVIQSPSFVAGYSPAGRSPVDTYSGNPTPPMSGNTTPNFSSFNAGPIGQPPALRFMPPRKRSIQKTEIGEPTFISSTSVVDTIALPPGASLRNGMHELAPPIPPVNPRRRMFGFGRSGESSPAPHTPTSNSPPRDNASVFEDDDIDNVGGVRSRTRLPKKSSSITGLNERSKRDREAEQAFAGVAEAQAPDSQVLHRTVGGQPIVMQGGMF